MFKVTINKNKYSILCYFLDKNSNKYQEAWSISNISEREMVRIMQTSESEEQMDLDVGIQVLKSGNDTLFFSDKGEILPTPLKTMVKLEEAQSGRSRVPVKDLLFSGKRRGKVPSKAG